jgi:hypothetical protein
VTIENCMTYNNQGQCGSCLTGFTLINNSCVIKTTLVHPKPANCAQYTNNVCSQCVHGFNLINGLCYKPNCIQNDKNGHCSQCTVGYTLIN